MEDRLKITIFAYDPDHNLRCSDLHKAWSPLRVLLTKPSQQPTESQPAADRHQIFEQIALERLQRGGDHNKPAHFLSLPVRATAIAATSITALGVLWACLARVPVQVDGIASIAPDVQVSSASATVGGVLAYQVSGVGPNRLGMAQRQDNQEISSYWGEDWDLELNGTRLNALALAALAPIEGQKLLMPESLEDSQRIDNNAWNKEVYQKLYFTGNTVIARIDNTSAMQQLDSVRITTLPKLELNQSIVGDRTQRAGQYDSISRLLESQRGRSQKELQAREDLFQRLKSLWTKGYVSTSQLLQEQATVNNLRSQVLQIDRDRVNTGFGRTDQRQQIEETILNSRETKNQLQTALVEYIEKVYTFAPPSGMYLVSTSMRNGMEVKAGDELYTYSIEKPTLPTVIPVFVDAATSQQLGVGMQVLVTPKGISRAQYGGILGVVDQVGKIPLPPEGIAAFAGGRTLASTIQQNISNAYLVRVKLQQEDPAYCQQMLSLRCYRWSTRRRPPLPVRLGTLADVQINVQYRRPIEFVMPALRQALGLVVENR